MILKRILALGLAVVTSLSVMTTNVYATGVNSGSSGSEVAGSWAEYAHRFFAYPHNQGIRMYLVGQDGNLVSDAVDILERYPWQMGSWGDFGGDSRAAYERFKYSYGWSTPQVDERKKARGKDKEKTFAYLTGVKTLGFNGESVNNIDFGVNKRPFVSMSSVNANIRYLHFGEFNNELMEATKNPATGEHTFTGGFVDPSFLMGEAFHNGGSVISSILKNKYNNNIGAYYLVNMKLSKGSFSGDDKNRLIYHTGTGGKYLFNLLDDGDRSAVDSGQKKVSDIMREKKYKLALEPIYYFVPELKNMDPFNRVSGKDYSYTLSPRIFYGTVSSLIFYVKDTINEAVKGDGENSSLGEFLKSSSGKIDLSVITVGGDWNTANLGISTFQTETEEKFGNATISKFDATPDIHASKDYFSLKKLSGDLYQNTAPFQGYGIMFYSVDDTGAYTSTFDSDRYGSDYNEGPSPENTNSDGTFPTKYPSEGNEFKTVNKDHKFRIVKFYREIDGDGNKKCIKNFTRENTVHNINIADEGDYKVDGWFTGDSDRVPTSQSDCFDAFKNSIPNIQRGGSSGSVSIPPTSTEKTLYMVLTKRLPSTPKPVTGTPSKLTLEQDELAYTYKFSDIRTLFNVGHKIPAKRTITKRNVSMDKSNYDFEVVNSENYGNSTYIGAIGNFAPRETGVVKVSGDINYSLSGRTLTIPSQRLDNLSPNLMFSIYRDRAKDKVTLYPKYNDGVKNELRQIGINSIGYSPAQNRVGTNVGSGAYQSQFRATYGYKAKDDLIKYSYDVKRRHGDYETVTRTFRITEGVGLISQLRNYYNTSITTKYFLGQPNTGNVLPNRTSRERFSINGKTFNGNLYYDYSKGSLGFYPFTRMRYHSVADTNNKFAFVTSTNKSSMYGVTAVDSGVYRSNPTKYGIDIQSNQWSTHTRAVEGLSRLIGNYAQPNKSLIPGGATMDLKSANTSNDASQIWLGFRTYQVSLPDSSSEAYIEKTGIDSTSSAIDKGKAFANEVKDVITGYHVEKFAKAGIVNENGFNGASKVASGGTFAGKALSRDKKYYLRDDAGSVGTSQYSGLDVIGEEPITQVTYRVYKNSANNLLNSQFGVITVEKNGSVLVSGNKSSVLANQEVKDLDSRTKVITNLDNALDNGGNSSDRNNQNWYYEGNEPIEVVMSTFAYQIGFGGNNTVRSEVIDPKLVGKLDNKGDLLNFNDDKLTEKTRTIQYKLSSGSDKAKTSGANYMGTFNGIKVVIPGMTDVFKSRLHYMGNNTVQDLN